MSYIVTGFYTPNYAHFADTFRRNLNEYSISHKLYAVDPIGETWIAQPLRKPSIILQAMAEYPGRPVILMDIDCSVHGDLSPLIVGDFDVSFTIVPRDPPKKVICSSHVVVCHPTDNTARFLSAWKSRCDAAIEKISRMRVSRHRLFARNLIKENDERLLMHALADVPELHLKLLPGEYSGTVAKPDALVTHESARDRIAPGAIKPSLSSWIRSWLT